MRNVAILRFSPTEGPGHFADWLDAHGIGWELVPLDQGVRVPADSREFAGIGMMGGPMGVNDDLPWVEPVCALLSNAVAAGVPVIGHCLGGQLLAKAMGAPVSRARNAEIGWIDVEATDPAARAAWFGGRPSIRAFQWHYDAFALPQGAIRVLTNAFNDNQAYVIDDRHIGMQFHVEMTLGLVETWLASGASELPQTSTASTQSAADIRSDLDARITSLNAVAGDVYSRWSCGLVR